MKREKKEEKKGDGKKEEGKVKKNTIKMKKKKRRKKRKKEKRKEEEIKQCKKTFQVLHPHSFSLTLTNNNKQEPRTTPLTEGKKTKQNKTKKYFNNQKKQSRFFMSLNIARKFCLLFLLLWLVLGKDKEKGSFVWETGGEWKVL